jgi:hypothetical protein
VGSHYQTRTARSPTDGEALIASLKVAGRCLTQAELLEAAGTLHDLIREHRERSVLAERRSYQPSNAAGSFG